MADRVQRGVRARGRGFTLIEVLGAVAILGVWYVMLATLAMQGMTTVGESQRRLQASLIADATLAEFELATAQGQSIEIGSEEEEEEPFTISIEVIDLTDASSDDFAAESDLDEGPGDLLAFFVSQNDSPFTEIRGGNWLLEFLREVRITVSWEEGPNELSVQRNAYLWDQDAFMNRDISLDEEGGSAAEPDGLIGS